MSDTKGIDQKLEEVFGEAAVLAAERLPTYFVDLCESPIEKLFLCALWARGCWFGDVELVHTQNFGDLVRMSDKTSHIIGSPQVTLGDYRADFLLLTSRSDEDAPCALVVECDGHDFHEKTKAQAARDKARDREMLAGGIHVMRFTGSEVWADAGACASDAIWFLKGERIDSAWKFEARRMKAWEEAQRQ